MKNKKVAVTANDQVGLSFHCQLQNLVVIRISAYFNCTSRFDYGGLIRERLQEFVTTFPRHKLVKLLSGQHIGRFVEGIWRGEKNSGLE